MSLRHAMGKNRPFKTRCDEYVANHLGLTIFVGNCHTIKRVAVQAVNGISQFVKEGAFINAFAPTASRLNNAKAQDKQKAKTRFRAPAGRVKAPLLGGC